jgi:hypothetical protein
MKAPLARVLALCAALIVLSAIAAPGSASAARAQCGGTFRVIHDDHVGRLSLPQGNYGITILASGKPGCAQASKLFTRFLEDYDGVLPGGWRVGAANSTFVKGAGVGFHVRRVGGSSGGGNGGEEESGGSGRHPASGSFCPSTFRVLNRDHIGALQFAAGRYWIVLLQGQGLLSCAEAVELFARFLDDASGTLPSPWISQPASATFTRGQSGLGFRVKPVG